MTLEAPRVIEATTPEEFALVGDLFREYASSLGWDPADSHLAGEIAALPGPYGPPRGSLMLAFIGDGPAGALGLQPVPEPCRIPGTGAERAGELKRLFVLPESRRYGVARALMLRSEAEALARGYDSLVLTTSAEMMPLAQPLYDSLGYLETVPYRDDMLWPDIRWMRKGLTSGA